MKTYEQCKTEIAEKYGFKKLGAADLMIYFDEAHELYMTQLKPLQDDIAVIYKLINFHDLDEPYKENLRQARKKLNKLTGDLKRMGK
jgi:hypothetical protein